MGYGGHLALQEAQRGLEARMGEWFAGAHPGSADADRASTALGHIGTLKLSDRIILRVLPGAGKRPPQLLRDASYNVFNSSVWLATDASLIALQPQPDRTTWILAPGVPPDGVISISAYLDGGQGLLPLPGGAVRVERMPAAGMKRNRLGALKVEGAPGVIAYHVAFAPRPPFDGPPDEIDLRIPRREAPVVARIASDLGLGSRSPREVLTAIRTFFAQNFRYSLFRADPTPGPSPLTDFLLRSRAGHCEYFATATVLLLRAAGIPARYATGYAVEEFSRLEGAYVVRARHGHSWALAYLGGAWHDLDTTPASWLAAERGAAWLWEPAIDLWAWVAFRFARWHWKEGEGWPAKVLPWLLLPLAAILAWRLIFVRRVARRAPDGDGAEASRRWPGDDSEFYAIERRFHGESLGRYPSEPPGSWVARIERSPRGELTSEGLRAIVSLHCRYRFDPQGISQAEREALRAQALAWLERHPPRT